MDTPNELIVKARPFFLSFFNKLANDMHTLTAAPVSCSLGDIAILEGRPEVETIFEVDRSVAKIIEDGTHSGTIHILLDVANSIALTGLMMMMGESFIKEQVKSRTYTEEIQEGFQEVANQMVGAMNDVVERKLKGSHLFLDGTSLVQYGEFPSSIEEDGLYLSVSVDITVANYASEPAKWLLSQRLAENLLGVKFPGGEDDDGMEMGPDEESIGPDGQRILIPGKPRKKAPPSGVDLSGYANVGVDPSLYAGKLPDLSGYVGELDEDGLPKGGPVDLSAYAGGDEEGAKRARPSYNLDDGLPHPDAPGGVKVVTKEVPFSLKEEEKVIRAINAMRQDGYRFIGIDDKDGKLVRIITQSDLRQIMGPFFGTKAMSARDKAICVVPLSKINKDQKTIRITTDGTINQAAELVQEFDLRALPVVSKQGILRGFITATALLEYFRKKRQG